MGYTLQIEASTLIFSLISCIIAIIGSILGVVTYFSNKKDKAVKDTKENNYELIKYQISEIKEDVKTILGKFDNYEKDIDEKIEKAIDLHIKLYHTKEK